MSFLVHSTYQMAQFCCYFDSIILYSILDILDNFRLISNAVHLKTVRILKGVKIVAVPDTNHLTLIISKFIIVLNLIARP